MASYKFLLITTIIHTSLIFTMEEKSIVSTDQLNSTNFHIPKEVQQFLQEKNPSLFYDVKDAKLKYLSEETKDTLYIFSQNYAFNSQTFNLIFKYFPTEPAPFKKITKNNNEYNTTSACFMNNPNFKKEILSETKCLLQKYTPTKYVELKFDKYTKKVTILAYQLIITNNETNKHKVINLETNL